MNINPDFDKETRHIYWSLLLERIEQYLTDINEYRVTPKLDPALIRDFSSKYDFGKALGFEKAMDHIISGLAEFQVHTPHPGYYGLFNPRPVFPGIAGDLITAVFNPQLAAWSHSPFANEVENFLIREFGKKFGYEDSSIDGNFTYGGGESNFTALLCALNNHFPEYAQKGLSGIAQKPVFYASSESHHSFVKAARMAGLGTDNLRLIKVDSNLKMDPSHLESIIKQDLNRGCSPFMAASTAGTTGAGVIDPLDEIETVCRKFNLWHHVDAAYGGAGILVPGLKPLFSGIEKSDSLIFDAHKWLSVPMAGSMLITRHKNILSQTFRTTAGYMPKEAEGMQVIDPFSHSLQWSRRFTGLKLYLSLLVFGWDGYAEILQHQINMGRLLKEKLSQGGWKIYNNTELPVALFGHPRNESPEFVNIVCKNVQKSGNAWISTYLMQGLPALRACITNYNTGSEDIDNLINELKINLKRI